MEAKFHGIIPVLPSSNIERDVAWYYAKVGLEPVFHDNMYAVLKRDNLYIHLQWHADNENDPLLGGSVIRIDVENIKLLFAEFIKRGTVVENKFISNTPWGTNEFGFFDLNKNAIFFMEDYKE